MAEQVYLYSLELMEAYHFLHVSFPKETSELYGCKGYTEAVCLYPS